MSSDHVLTINNISKCYQIYDQPIDRLKQFLYRGRKIFYREFWALNPISLGVRKGECVGFIGRNGSGKSTLLQMIAGTVTPTTGSITLNGKVAALLELGAGFNPEFTGIENVYLNGALYGLSNDEITAKLPQIEQFAEIGSFIHQPVKTYSSGMYVRLAFAAAIHVDPDIFIVDEALAVGDAAFQYKCMCRIRDLQAKGMSIIFVTHDTLAVKQFCTYAGWIHEGNLVSYGKAADVAHEYEDFMRLQMKPYTSDTGLNSNITKESSTTASATAHRGRIIEAELLNLNEVPSDVLVTGSSVLLKIHYEVLMDTPEGFAVGAAIFRNDDAYMCGLNTFIDKHTIPSSVGKHTVTLHYDHLNLLPGSYYIKTGLFDHNAMVCWDFHHRAAAFTMTGPHLAEGTVVLQHKWMT